MQSRRPQWRLAEMVASNTGCRRSLAGPGERGRFRDDMLEVAFTQDVAHLYALGPRSIGELLTEGARLTVCTEIEILLRGYRRLDLATVAQLGGRSWQ